MQVPCSCSADDAKVASDTREVKPCCKRLPNHVWCALPEGHAGRCLGYATEMPPPPPPAHEVCQCSSCKEKR